MHVVMVLGHSAIVVILPQNVDRLAPVMNIGHEHFGCVAGVHGIQGVQDFELLVVALLREIRHELLLQVSPHHVQGLPFWIVEAPLHLHSLHCGEYLL